MMTLRELTEIHGTKVEEALDYAFKHPFWSKRLKEVLNPTAYFVCSFETIRQQLEQENSSTGATLVKSLKEAKVQADASWIGTPAWNVAEKLIEFTNRKLGSSATHDKLTASWSRKLATDVSDWGEPKLLGLLHWLSARGTKDSQFWSPLIAANDADYFKSKLDILMTRYEADLRSERGDKPIDTNISLEKPSALAFELASKMKLPSDPKVTEAEARRIDGVLKMHPEAEVRQTLNYILTDNFLFKKLTPMWFATNYERYATEARRAKVQPEPKALQIFSKDPRYAASAQDFSHLAKGDI